jgi:GTP cyclohydrolase I
MAAAILEFLAAAGLDLGDPQLAETPSRVATAWVEDYLDGYAKDPAVILGERHPVKSKQLVIVKGLDFHSMCPHHLVPYRGVAHVGYLPKKGVVGFGKLVELVDCFAHRLILQEQIAEEVVGALVKELGAAGAACVLDAEQACMTTRGPKRRGARTITRAFKGKLDTDARLQDAFLKGIGLGR